LGGLIVFLATLVLLLGMGPYVIDRYHHLFSEDVRNANLRQIFYKAGTSLFKWQNCSILLNLEACGRRRKRRGKNGYGPMILA